MNIKSVLARRIWDSRGNPTVEVELSLENGLTARGIAPAGASTGQYEALELRDGGSAFGGKDVQKALAGLRKEIAPALVGRDVFDQAGIDRMLVELDGTPAKSRLGSNALVATSLAVLHAAAAASEKPLWQYLANGKPASLPMPQIQIFGGGAHAEQRVDIQDFLIIPLGAKNFAHSLEMTAEVYRHAGLIMKKRGLLAGVADEGGYWPMFKNNEDVLSTLVQAIENAGFDPGKEVGIALDVASSEFYKDGLYTLALDAKKYNSEDFIELLLRWVERYPVVSLEDAMAEDDEAGMIALTKALGDRIQIIGDDFFVTNAARIRKAAPQKACNAVLIKVNQVGTVTETLAAMHAAREASYATIVSARSGETEDVAITHLATGWNAGQLKVGSFTRSERMAKWNEGIRIETSPGGLAFAGAKALAGARWV